MKRYIALAKAVGALKRCQEHDNQEWAEKHANAILELMEKMPHGSGIDCGVQLAEESTGERLVFNVAFHHMDEGGGYDGWTEHQMIVTPSFEVGYHSKLTGRNRNGIKEYLAETIGYVLDQDVAEHMGYKPIGVATVS